MVTNSCPTCSNQSFELVNAKPIELKYQVLVLQCASCKYVIGTFMNDETEKINQKLQGIQNQQDRGGDV